MVDLATALAYLLPLLFLVAFIGNAGKKFPVYLLWGFIAAVPSVILTPFFFGAFPELAYHDITVAPVVEEFFKALPLLVLAFGATRISNRDILVYALASGIGFSMAETGLELVPSLLTPLFPLVPGLAASLQPEPLTFAQTLGRSFSTSLLHGCTCGIIGYGIVLAKNVDRKALTALLFGFYTIAVTTHAFYNMFFDFFGRAGIVIDLVFPIVLFLFLLVCYSVDLPELFCPGGTGEPG